MATVVASISQPVSKDRIEPGSYPLRAATYPPTAPIKASPAEVAKEWSDQLNEALKAVEIGKIKTLLMKESYWRDQLCLSWDFHTFSGPEKVAEFLEGSQKEVRIKSVSLDTSSSLRSPALSAIDLHGKVPCVNFFLHIETDVGNGIGVVKLVQDLEDGSRWKAFTLFTTLRELKGHEELIGRRRPIGVRHGEDLGRKSWQDIMNEQREFVTGEPVVLIIGAGHGGLTSAVRLKQLCIPTLVIDQNDRVGDNWRKRYHQLVLHDPVWYDHMPYVPFPANWPIFAPKDKLAEWFECYVKIMELSVWTNTSIESAKWNEAEKRWTINLARIVDGRTVKYTFHPKHVIQATGHSGEKYFPSNIKGIRDFKGDLLCHSSEFTSAKENGKGKKAVVVGCCNSAHDIAQDYYEKGYDVTMVQRSSTAVVSIKTVLDVALGGLYQEGGIDVEDADLIFQGIPNPVLKRLHTELTVRMNQCDSAIHNALTAAGFAVDSGPNESGFFIKYLVRGGGYYLDVGCSKLIADGKIAIVQGQEIQRVNANSLTFANGKEIPADEIVFATGFQNMCSVTRKIFGDEVAGKVGGVWGMDEEGELRVMWRPSGQQGLWFVGGNLALSRYYSRLVALQIKAAEVGLLKY